jgi:hypothetical protein
MFSMRRHANARASLRAAPAGAGWVWVCSARYSSVSVLKSAGWASARMRSAVTTMAGTARCQWRCDDVKRGAKRMGSRTPACSAIRLWMYWLLHRLSARSATWKCGLATHAATRVNTGRMTCSKTAGSTTSRSSSSSLMYRTSLCEFVLGQYRSIALMIGGARDASFSIN